MGFFDQLRDFVIKCVNGIYHFLTKTIEVIWKGITFPIKLIFDGASIVMDFIIDGVSNAYDFIVDSLNQLKKAGAQGNLDKVYNEISRLRVSNLQMESFTYKLKMQDAKTIFI